MGLASPNRVWDAGALCSCSKWRPEIFMAVEPEDLRDAADDPDHDGLNNAIKCLTGWTR